jgi:hypothetical protein
VDVHLNRRTPLPVGVLRCYIEVYRESRELPKVLILVGPSIVVRWTIVRCNVLKTNSFQILINE